jgi:phosphopantothenate-cysteine ligase
MLQVLRKYHDARDRNMLLLLPFVSISDYLHELRSVAQLMHPLGPRGLLYLAAAVSDFFVPVRTAVPFNLLSPYTVHASD